MDRLARSRQTDKTPPSLDELVRGIVRDELRALRAEQTTHAPALAPIDVALACTRRRAAEICREGRIDGAVLVARRWCAPPEAIQRYVASLAAKQRRHLPAPANDGAEPTADDVLEELGLRRVAGGRR